MTVMGIDPGGRETGIIVRLGDDLVDWVTLVRKGTDSFPDPTYLRSVVGAVRDMTEAWQVSQINVEGVKAPNPHKGMSNPTGIMGTAMVLGAIEALFDVQVVEPDKMGKHPLMFYPEQLRPRSGKGLGKDKLRHCRSAYDISYVGGHFGTSTPRTQVAARN